MSYALTPAGWITMLLSVGFVTVFFGWCIWRVLTTPGSAEHVKDPTLVDTHDQDT